MQLCMGSNTGGMNTAIATKNGYNLDWGLSEAQLWNK